MWRIPYGRGGRVPAIPHGRRCREGESKANWAAQQHAGFDPRDV